MSWLDSCYLGGLTSYSRSKRKLSVQVPSFAERWTNLVLSRIRDVDHAYKSLDALFHSMISKRAGEMQRGKEMNEDIDDKINDVFGKLVQAQVSEGTKLSLQDQEIIGNCFILMLAGHGERLFPT